jgi:malate dehydrogenase (oxaloacetate-decarboxylating)
MVRDLQGIWWLALTIFRCIDKPGLLVKSLGEQLTPAQRPFARDDHELPEGQGLDLLSVVTHVKPHVLIGTSTKPKAFTQEIIREMAKHVERPIVLPLSNPTRLHEAEPKDIYEWTEGRALVATGSPFAPVEYRGVKYEIGKGPQPFVERLLIWLFHFLR